MKFIVIITQFKGDMKLDYCHKDLQVQEGLQLVHQLQLGKHTIWPLPADPTTTLY